MISFFKHERDAHHWALNKSIERPENVDEAKIYEYEVLTNGYGSGHAYVVVVKGKHEKHDERDQLVPKEAKHIWTYKQGIPKQETPKVSQASTASSLDTLR